MGDSQGQGNWPKPLQQRLGSPFSPWEGVGVQERGEGRAPAALQGTRQPRGPGHARERPGAPEGASADPVTPPLSTASRPHGKPDTNASGMRHRCLCTEARAQTERTARSSSRPEVPWDAAASAPRRVVVLGARGALSMHRQEPATGLGRGPPAPSIPRRGWRIVTEKHPPRPSAAWPQFPAMKPSQELQKAILGVLGKI